MQEKISFSELAERLNVEITTVRRRIKALNLPIHRSNKGNKFFLTKDDANHLINHYEIKSIVQEEIKSDRFGYFYIVQLIPEALPNRVKIGFADNIDRRVVEHRTAAPTAKLVKYWPCKRSWYYAAMDCITRENCKHVLNEVFEGDINSFVERANSFFSLMPKPESKRELSEHSPLAAQKY